MCPLSMHLNSEKHVIAAIVPDLKSPRRNLPRLGDSLDLARYANYCTWTWSKIKQETLLIIQKQIKQEILLISYIWRFRKHD